MDSNRHAEVRTERRLIGQLHAQIWRVLQNKEGLDPQTAQVAGLRRAIGEHERRIREIMYLARHAGL